MMKVIGPGTVKWNSSPAFYTTYTGCPQEASPRRAVEVPEYAHGFPRNIRRSPEVNLKLRPCDIVRCALCLSDDDIPSIFINDIDAPEVLYGRAECGGNI